MASPLKIVISTTLSLLIIRGLYDLIFNIYPNHCEMTYMFQVPEYIPIKLADGTEKLFPNYKLYVYGEGHYASSLKSKTYNGIPVLFIPGNAGSYKQVRSLASVAYTKSINERTPFHFNFFTADLNEELGALFGPVLDHQTHFVRLAIKNILKLYNKSKVKPKSVILIGHSMGGMVAQAVLTLSDISQSIVPLIITLATPIARPVVFPDHDIDAFYSKVTSFWILERNFDLKDIVLISVGGGRNDLLVSSILTSSEIIDVDTTTMSVPSCWLTTDHLAIVWCRQLVLSLTRALFNSIDRKSLSSLQNKSNVIAAFKHQLLERAGSQHNYPQKFPSKLIQLQDKGRWSEIMKRQYHQEFDNLKTNSFLMIPIYKDHRYYKHLSIVGKDIDWKDWIFACHPNVMHNNSRVCSNGINLSEYGVVVPGDRKQIELELQPLLSRGITHCVIWVQPNDDKVSIDFDVSDGESRRTEFVVPTLSEFMYSTLVTAATPIHSLTYNVSLSGITEPWQSYTLTILPLHKCSEDNQLPIVKTRPSWYPRWDYVLSGPSQFEFSIEIDVPLLDKSENSSMDVHVILNPSCTYNISLQPSVTGVFRRIAVLYGLQIPSYVACHFLLALSTQFKSLGTTGKCPSILSSMIALSPISVVPFVKLLSYGLGKVELDSDLILLQKNGIDLPMLPIFMFLACLMLSLGFAFISWILVISCGNAAHTFAIRVLKRSLRTTTIVTDVAVAGITRVPVIVAVVLLSLGYATCGAASLYIASGFYFIKVFKLYENMLEDSLIPLVPGSTRAQHEVEYSAVNLNFTLMMLLFLLSLLNLPSVITWANSTGSNLQLTSDPSWAIGAIAIVSFAVIWQLNLGKPKKFYTVVGHLIHICAVLVVLFGSVRLYRVSYLLSASLLITALHQLLSPDIKDHDIDKASLENSHSGAESVGKLEASKQDEQVATKDDATQSQEETSFDSGQPNDEDISP